MNAHGGSESQAIGRTKGGWNTKLHTAVDNAGVPLALLLTPGHEADISHAPDVLQEIEGTCIVGDKGYDSDDLRAWLRERGVTPCIPPRSNRVPNPIVIEERIPKAHPIREVKRMIADVSGVLDSHFETLYADKGPRLGLLPKICAAGECAVVNSGSGGDFALKTGARYRVRTCDPYRVKVVLYH